MLDYNVARSMCFSPILHAITESGIKPGEIAFLTGLDNARVFEVAMGRGPEATLEEAARFASLVGMELSVVPEPAGIAAFTEWNKYPIIRANMGGYARRIVDMTEKVADFCVDLRIATELPSAIFERCFNVEEGFMCRIADNELSAATNLQEMYAYLSAFGATLAAFPRTSPYTNYYRALMEIEPTHAVSKTSSLKAA
jgi:hypothetical protein